MYAHPPPAATSISAAPRTVVGRFHHTTGAISTSSPNSSTVYTGAATVCRGTIVEARIATELRRATEPRTGVVPRMAGVGRGVRRPPAGPDSVPSMSANACAVCGRSTAVFASAWKIASSTWGGTVARTTRTLGTCSMRCLAMIAMAFGPVKGGSPASIS